MARITQDNENYYIAKSALVLTENAVTGSAAHRYIAASVAAGTKIRVARLVLPDSHGQMIPVIDWAADLEYSQWNLRAYNTVLNEEYDSVPVYLYVRLNRKDMTDALVIYSPNEYDYLGPAGSGSGSGSGSGYDDDELMDGTYIYLKIGTLSAPSNGLRSLVYDTGKLGTAKGNEEQSTALLDSMFRLVGEYIQPQKWFEKIETNILSMMNGAAVKTVTAISDIISDISEQTIDHLKATLPTAYAVASYIKAKIEALSEVFLSKVNDDTAAGHIAFDKGLTAHDAVDSDTGEAIPSVSAETVVGDLVHVSVAAEFGDDFQEGIQGARIYQTQGGQWKGEFDYLKVHRKFEVEELEVMHTSHIGGKLMNTAANMVISEVWAVATVDDVDIPFLRNAGNGPEKLDEDLYDAYVDDRSVATKYVCLFATKDGEKIIVNKWQVDDQAYCESFNLAGYTDDLGNVVSANHFFWRRVIALQYPAKGNAIRGYLHDDSFYSDADHTLLIQPSSDESYFDIPTSTYYIWNGQQGFTPGVHTVSCVVLSNLDDTTAKADYSDPPIPGDEVVQLGNQSSDFGDRQGAIVLAAADSDEVVTPYIQLYRGINSFSLPQPFIRLAPDSTWIKANDIFIGDAGAEESIKDTLHGLTDGEFLIWQLSTSAPASADDIHWNSTAVQGLPSTAWTTETERNDHIDDVIIFTGGESYRFLRKNSSWYWCIFTDKYLIDTTNTLRNIFADNKVTPDEKKELRKTYDDLLTTYDSLYARTHGSTSEITTAEFGIISEIWDGYADKWATVSSVLLTLLATPSSTSDISAGQRTTLTEGIAQVYLLAQTTAQVIEDVQLKSTGWHKQDRKFVVTADQFEIQNNHGQRNLYVDPLGDLNIRGILNTNAITIDISNAKDYLVPLTDINTMFDPDYKQWDEYAGYDSVRGEREYYTGQSSTGDIDTFSPFCSSSDITIDDSLADEVPFIHSLDVMRTDGLVVLDSSLIPGTSETSEPYHWFALNDGQQYRNILLLPFFRNVDVNGTMQFSTLRTPTRNDTNTLHLLTLDEMRSLVGKKMTIANNTGQHIAILVCGACYENDDYITKTRDGVNAEEAQVTKVTSYDDTEYYTPVPHGTSVTVEYKEAVRFLRRNSAGDGSHAQNTTVVDIIPSLVSVSSVSQQFGATSIIGQQTFGSDKYPSS